MKGDIFTMGLSDPLDSHRSEWLCVKCHRGRTCHCLAASEHHGRLFGPRAGPEQFIRSGLGRGGRSLRARHQPGRQPIDDERMQRQFRAASGLFVLGGNRDRRRFGLEVECRQPERRQFVCPESRHRRQQLQRGAVQAGQTAERRRALLGGINQP